MHHLVRLLLILLAAQAGAVATELPSTASSDLETRLRALEAQQDELLRKLRAELAAIPVLPPESATDSVDLKSQRSRKTALQQLLTELEDRLRQLERTKYIHPRSVDPGQRDYYEAIAARLESFKLPDDPVQGRPISGEVALNITVLSTGEIIEVEVLRSTSTAVAQRAQQVLRAASPLPAFSSQLSRDADRVVITTRFIFKSE